MPRKKYGPDLDKYLEDRERKYVSYEQGARLYSMPYYSFVRLTKDAQANLRMRRSVVVDLDILEKYILKNLFCSKVLYWIAVLKGLDFI